MNQWSAGLERQFGNSAGVELQYLGSTPTTWTAASTTTRRCPGPGASTPAGRTRFWRDPHHSNDVIANYESMSVISASA